MSHGYEYDLFLSYKRAGNVPGWVENHFYPLLLDALIDLRPVTPRIFLDTQQEIGVRWPDNLAHALQRSRYLIAVWSVPYFESPWCMAEWKSMLRREQILGMATRHNPQGLVYPVVFADGDNFPEQARVVQARKDLSRWAIPFLGFRETAAYVEFYQSVREVAATLAARLDQAPAWDPNWPVDRATLAAEADRLDAQVDKLIAGATHYPPNRRLLGHLANERGNLFTFLRLGGVEATNWRAEHAIRPAVVCRKAWGGNRTWAGADTWQVLASVLRTASQQHRDPIGLLTRLLQAPVPMVAPDLAIPASQRSDWLDTPKTRQLNTF